MVYGILGGDLRNVELAKLLAKEKNMVYTYGLEKAISIKKDNNILQCTNISNIQKAQFIITSIPITKDGKTLNMPLSDEKLKIEDLFNIFSGKIVFSGNISNDLELKFHESNINIVDIMRSEEFAILNAIPTAEETIKIMIENTKRIIHGTNCLILGYGRIGKILAKKLKGLSVNVTCFTNDEIEESWIETEGYNIITLEDIKNNKILTKFDIIINTIPKIIFKEELMQISKQTLIIDLASKPYGIDRDIVKREKLNFIEALGLPGKRAPITVSENMKRIIDKVLDEKFNI